MSKKRAEAAVELLKEKYPEAKCSLNYESPFQLLVAARLSAQCTDERVNKVTSALFAEFPTVNKMANATLETLEKYIQPCGLQKTKSRDIREMSRVLQEEYGGNVPDTMEALIKLPGIGRKTANLILGDVYGKPAVVADTHFIRISNRMGFVDTRDPLKVEMQMRSILPREESNDFCHRAVLFGREVCTARNPLCDGCVLREVCKRKGVKEK